MLRRGRKLALSFSLVALLALSLAAASCSSGAKKPTATGPPAQAVVISATGELPLRLAGSETWLAAGADTALFEGDDLSVAVGRSMLLLPATGSVELNQGSCLRLALDGTRPSLTLRQGELLLNSKRPPRAAGTKAPAGLRLATPVSTVSATDCDLDLKVTGGGATTLTVLRGQAQFAGTTGAAVTVQQGQASSVAPGGAPGAPAAADAKAARSWAKGPTYLIDTMVPLFFTDEEVRDNIQTDAKSKIDSGTIDPWPYVNYARTLYDRGRLDEAKAQFEAALQLNPQFPQALEGLGRIALRRADWAAAADLFDRTRRLDRQSVEALYGLGLAQLGQGELSSAEEWFREALHLQGQDARSMAGLGIAEAISGDLAGSLSQLGEAVAADSSIAFAFAGEAMVYAMQGNAVKAAASLGSAAQAQHADLSAWNAAGIASLRQGKLDDASRQFRSVENAEDPLWHAFGFQNQGAVTYARGSFQDAVSDWEKSLDLAHDRPAVLVDLGLGHFALKQNDAAFADLDRAAALAPDNPYVHETYARLLLESGANDRAAVQARLAIAIDPSSWVGHLVLGLALQAMGQAGAKEELAAGLQAVPRQGLSAAASALVDKAGGHPSTKT